MAPVVVSKIKENALFSSYVYFILTFRKYDYFYLNELTFLWLKNNVNFPKTFFFKRGCACMRKYAQIYYAISFYCRVQHICTIIFRARSLVFSDLCSETKGSLGNQTFPVRVRLLAMCRGELSVVIARLLSKCLWSRWKW